MYSIGASRGMYLGRGTMRCPAAAIANCTCGLLWARRLSHKNVRIKYGLNAIFVKAPLIKAKKLSPVVPASIESREWRILSGENPMHDKCQLLWVSIQSWFTHSHVCQRVCLSESKSNTWHTHRSRRRNSTELPEFQGEVAKSKMQWNDMSGIQSLQCNRRTSFSCHSNAYFRMTYLLWCKPTMIRRFHKDESNNVDGTSLRKSYPIENNTCLMLTTAVYRYYIPLSCTSINI